MGWGGEHVLRLHERIHRPIPEKEGPRPSITRWIARGPGCPAIIGRRQAAGHSKRTSIWRSAMRREFATDILTRFDSAHDALLVTEWTPTLLPARVAAATYVWFNLAHSVALIICCILFARNFMRLLVPVAVWDLLFLVRILQLAHFLTELSWFDPARANVSKKIRCWSIKRLRRCIIWLSRRN